MVQADQVFGLGHVDDDTAFDLMANSHQHFAAYSELAACWHVTDGFLVEIFPRVGIELQFCCQVFVRSASVFK